MVKNIIIVVLVLICIALGIALIRQRADIRKEAAFVKEKKELRYKVAIVIDDWGYNRKNLEELFSLERAMTLAVLPNLRYSKYISNRANAEGLEVILHLPLEPHRKERHGIIPEADTIYCGMEKEQVLSRFRVFLNSVRHARGVSNHMGSKATEDPYLMAVIFGEMKRHGLYFLDSMVTKKSICKYLAKDEGLRYTKRDVFLDNENNPAYIKGQLLKLSEVAIRNGHAVGVGHDRRLTIKTIKETVPELEKKGIEFVFLSELL